jgi:hypothetical protein
MIILPTTYNCQLSLSLFTAPTNENSKLLFPTSHHRQTNRIGHTVVRLSLAARIIVVVDLLPSFWAAHGCKTGIELVLT